MSIKQELKFSFTESDILEILQEHLEKFYNLPTGTQLDTDYDIAEFGDHDKGTYYQRLEGLTLTVKTQNP